MVHLMGLSKAGWVFCGIVFHPFNYVTVHMVCNQWLHLLLSFLDAGDYPFKYL